MDFIGVLISISFQVSLSAGSTFDEFKVSISEAIGFPPTPDVTLKVCKIELSAPPAYYFI